MRQLSLVPSADAIEESKRLAWSPRVDKSANGNIRTGCAVRRSGTTSGQGRVDGESVLAQPVQRHGVPRGERRPACILLRQLEHGAPKQVGEGLGRVED